MRGQRRGPWGYAIPALTLLAGGVFAMSASTADGTDLRADSHTRLTELITDAEREHERTRGDHRALRGQVDSLGRRTAQRDDQARRAQARADQLAGTAGFTAASGDGIRVELDDAPRQDRPLPDDASPDDLVVHQQDVQGVVNALWAGGATAVQVMDQRVIATSAVRCVGNTLVLQGVVYSPPFRITAIGDRARMRAALDDSPELRTYQQYVEAYGLGYRVQPLEEIAMPAYSGSVTLDHASVPAEADHQEDNAGSHP